MSADRKTPLDNLIDFILSDDSPVDEDHDRASIEMFNDAVREGEARAAEEPQRQQKQQE